MSEKGKAQVGMQETGRQYKSAAEVIAAPFIFLLSR